MSTRPNVAARCRAVVPDAGGCTPFGEMARWDKRRATVSTGAWSTLAPGNETNYTPEPQRTAR